MLLLLRGALNAAASVVASGSRTVTCTILAIAKDVDLGGADLGTSAMQPVCPRDHESA